MLALRGVRRAFGDVVAVDGVDLEVAAGECAVLLGPDGAGKSTLLALAAGELRPTAGTVTVGGRDVHHDDPWVRRQVAHAPHEPAFYPDLSVADHVRLVALAHGVGAAADELADGLLADWGLEAHRDALPDRLSNGLRRRLQLVCCLVRPLTVLLLDEPAAALDPRARRVLWRWIAAVRDRGAAVVVGANDLDVPDGLVDRLVVMRAGRVAAAGPLDGARRRAAVQALGLEA